MNHYSWMRNLFVFQNGKRYHQKTWNQKNPKWPWEAKSWTCGKEAWLNCMCHKQDEVVEATREVYVHNGIICEVSSKRHPIYSTSQYTDLSNDPTQQCHHYEKLVLSLIHKASQQKEDSNDHFKTKWALSTDKPEDEINPM